MSTSPGCAGSGWQAARRSCGVPARQRGGSATLGGRRVPVTRPRVQAADEPGELHLPFYDLFSSTEVLGRMAPEKMLAGLSSRRYGHGLEPAGQAVEAQAASTSKSAVSRRFVEATETAFGQLMSRRLGDLDLVAFMADEVHFGENTCVVALSIDIRRDQTPGVGGNREGLRRQRDPGHAGVLDQFRAVTPKPNGSVQLPSQVLSAYEK